LSYEKPAFTAEKRFTAQHYSYQDILETATAVLTKTQLDMLTAQALALGTLEQQAFFYRFGNNARTDSLMTMLRQNPYYLWLRTGDKVWLSGVKMLSFPAETYAKSVKITCDQDAHVRFVTINPQYIREYLMVASKAYPRTVAPPLLWHPEQPIPADEEITFDPTYGYGIAFRADTVIGNLIVWIEGNVEGTE
jgi:hypothetical protein